MSKINIVFEKSGNSDSAEFPYWANTNATAEKLKFLEATTLYGLERQVISATPGVTAPYRRAALSTMPPKYFSADRKAHQQFGAQLFTYLNEAKLGDSAANFGGLLAGGNAEKFEFNLMNAPRLAALPWELLYKEINQGGGFFVATNPDWCVKRVISKDPTPSGAPARSQSAKTLVICSTAGEEFDPRPEIRAIKRHLGRRIRRGLRSRRPVLIENASPQTFNNAVLEHKPHIIHIMGHGVSVDGTGGVKLHRVPIGGADVSSRVGHDTDVYDLAQILSDHKPWLIVLSACESASIFDLDNAISPASTLAEFAADYVVGMQTSVINETLATFADAFYSSLSETGVVEIAMSRARNQIYFSGKHEAPHEFAAPVLYAAPKEVNDPDCEKQIIGFFRKLSRLVGKVNHFVMFIAALVAVLGFFGIRNYSSIERSPAEASAPISLPVEDLSHGFPDLLDLPVATPVSSEEIISLTNESADILRTELRETQEALDEVVARLVNIEHGRYAIDDDGGDILHVTGPSSLDMQERLENLDAISNHLVEAVNALEYFPPKSPLNLDPELRDSADVLVAALSLTNEATQEIAEQNFVGASRKYDELAKLALPIRWNDLRLSAEALSDSSAILESASQRSPVGRVSPGKVLAPLSETVSEGWLTYFETDQIVLGDAERAAIRDVATQLNSPRYLETEIEIIGKADNRGPAAYNFSLSRERAQAIFAIMQKEGIEETRIRITAVGERYSFGVTAAQQRLDRAAEIRIKIPEIETVLFEFDDARLCPAAVKMISDVATWLNEHPDTELVIEGHADRTGDAQYNMSLSARRARRVRTELVNLGVSQELISIRTFGEMRPLSSANGNRNVDRRVEFTVK